VQQQTGGKVIKLFFFSPKDRPNKLEYLSLGKLFQLVTMFVVKAKCLLKRKNLKDVTLMYTLPLLSNIRLGWKGLPGTNTLAFLASLSVMKRSSKI